MSIPYFHCPLNLSFKPLPPPVVYCSFDSLPLFLARRRTAFPEPYDKMTNSSPYQLFLSSHQLIIFHLSISLIGDKIFTNFYRKRHLHLVPYSQMFSCTQQADKDDTLTPSCLFIHFFQSHWPLRVSQLADEWEICKKLDQWKYFFQGLKVQV